MCYPLSFDWLNPAHFKEWLQTVAANDGDHPREMSPKNSATKTTTLEAIARTTSEEARSPPL